MTGKITIWETFCAILCLAWLISLAASGIFFVATCLFFAAGFPSGRLYEYVIRAFVAFLGLTPIAVICKEACASGLKKHQQRTRL